MHGGPAPPKPRIVQAFPVSVGRCSPCRHVTCCPRWHGEHSNRDFRLAVCALARDVLSKDLAQKNELPYAASKLPIIEINGTFYSLQRPSSFQQWYEQTPENFIFSVKGPRYITHMRRLKDVATPLANFLASGVLGLKEKLGPILWQFPPQQRFDEPRFATFFEMLPHDTQAAARIARKCDERMKNRSLLKIDKKRPLRHAVEIRHESFLDEAFITLLRKHNIALVVAETARKWPMTHDVTADFVYMRLHGDKELYRAGTVTRRYRDGPAASKPGTEDLNRKMRNGSASARRLRARAATSTASLTIPTSSSAPPSTPRP